MKKNRKRKGKGLLILVICVTIALAGAIGLVVYKEIEYKTGTEYYSELRSGK